MAFSRPDPIFAVWHLGFSIISSTLTVPCLILCLAPGEAMLSVTFLLLLLLAEFSWLMQDKMGDFSAAVATWTSRSLSHIICQALLLCVQCIFKSQDPQSCAAFASTLAGWFTSSLRLSVAEVFRVAFTSRGTVMTMRFILNSTYKGLPGNEKKSFTAWPVPCTENFSKPQRQAVLVDRCQPKQMGWFYLFYFFFFWLS